MRKGTTITEGHWPVVFYLIHIFFFQYIGISKWTISFSFLLVSIILGSLMFPVVSVLIAELSLSIDMFVINFGGRSWWNLHMSKYIIFHHKIYYKFSSYAFFPYPHSTLSFTQTKILLVGRRLPHIFNTMGKCTIFHLFWHVGLSLFQEFSTHTIFITYMTYSFGFLMIWWIHYRFNTSKCYIIWHVIRIYCSLEKWCMLKLTIGLK